MHVMTVHDLGHESEYIRGIDRDATRCVDGGGGCGAVGGDRMAVVTPQGAGARAPEWVDDHELTADVCWLHVEALEDVLAVETVRPNEEDLGGSCTLARRLRRRR